jgi:uncharacterized damage-inducible protein DinB
MAKRASAKTSARSKRARPRKSTSARSSSSSGADVVRRQVAETLDWQHASVGFDKALAGLAPELRGRKPAGFPHSVWDLLEHMRIAQRDILEFCGKSGYVEKKWPDDYWSRTSAPPDDKAWDASIAAFKRDRAALQKLATDPKINLAAKVPQGTGQTYIRELMVIIDHNTHHLGQIIAVRRMLGAWE